MKQYEYKIELISNANNVNDLCESLDEEGKLGWELVCMDLRFNVKTCLVFKREKKVVEIQIPIEQQDPNHL